MIDTNYPNYRKKWRPNNVIMRVPLSRIVAANSRPGGLRKLHAEAARRGCCGFQAYTPPNMIKNS